MIKYNFDFCIAAIVVYIIITLYLCAKKRIKNDRYFIFVGMLSTCFIKALLDILSQMLIDLGIFKGLFYASCYIYFTTEVLATFYFLLLVMSFFEVKSQLTLKKKIYIRLPLYFTFVVVAILLLYNWNHVIMYFDYHKSKIQVVTYSVAAFYYIWALVYVYAHKAEYSKRMIYTIGNWMVVNSVCFFFQLVTTNYVLHSFGFSIGMVLLLLAVLDEDNGIDISTGMLSRNHLYAECSKIFYNKLNVSIILVRIADFDLITSTYGFANANKLKIEIGSYLQKVSDSGHAYQLSNSNFVLIYYDNAEVQKKIIEINNKLSDSWIVEDTEIFCSPFLLRLDCPDKISDMDNFVSYLMYFKKMTNKRYGIINTEEIKLKDKVRERQVEMALKNALENKSLKVYYQPICTSIDQRFVTSEALARLIDEKLGFVSPDEFITVAEKNGLIIKLGNYVLEQVCMFIKNHDMNKLGIEYIELNLSVIQVLQRDFMSQVDKIVGKYGVKPENLCFEITESAANCSPVIFAENLKCLRQRGFKLAMDDFGSGYGNLKRMVDSEFDIVKFDKDMTQTMLSEESNIKMFGKIKNVFLATGAKVVAEGVETNEQYEKLKTLGFEYIQGYYFSRPVPETEYIQFLEDRMNIGQF